MIQKFYDSENGGAQYLCTCNGENDYYNSQQYPFMNFSEGNTCRSLFLPGNGSPNPFEPLCDWIDYYVMQAWKNAIIVTLSPALSPYRWQMWMYENYFDVCAREVTHMISQTNFEQALQMVFNITSVPIPNPYVPYNYTNSSLPTATIDTTYYMLHQAFTDFGCTLQASLQSPFGFLCAGYLFNGTSTQYEYWTFDELIVPPYVSTAPPVVPPTRFQNHDANYNPIEPSYLYEAYLALYCNPTICTSYQLMPILTVLLNTAGTIATVFSGLMLLAAIGYTVSRAPIIGKLCKACNEGEGEEAAEGAEGAAAPISEGGDKGNVELRPIQ